MNTGGWQQIFSIFEEAAALPAEEQGALLDRVCGDVDIRRGVENLLAADNRRSTLIDRPLLRPSSGPTEVTAPQVDYPSAVGVYKLLRPIGQGGMSTVYLAVRDDDAFHRRVVVKLVRRGMETEAILQRLRTERQILASLDHPYIASLHDGGSTEDGLPYFVMEHIDGVPIDIYCERDHLSLAARGESRSSGFLRHLRW